MSQGNLAGEACEKIKAVSPNDENANHVGHMLHTEAENPTQRRSNKGETHKKENEKTSHPNFYPESMEDLLVVLVGAMK